MEDAVVGFRARVHAEIDPVLAVGAARVCVRTTGGKIFNTQVVHARGSLQRPMTDAEIVSKVRSLAALGFPACDFDCLIDAVWELERLKEVAELVRLAAAH